jgi:predicted lipoprotein with Yx(FWY)xxD motif
MRSTVRTSVVVVTTVLFAVTGSGCSDSGGKPSSSASENAKTVSAHSGNLGKILAGSQGKVLYRFDKDSTSKSACSGDCSKAWPPMVVKDNPVAGGGTKKDLLATSKRGDGKKQVTYDGHPLYYFQGDGKAGQTNGQGLNQFGAKWYVVGSDGKQIKKKAKGGGGGGY